MDETSKSFPCSILSDLQKGIHLNLDSCSRFNDGRQDDVRCKKEDVSVMIAGSAKPRNRLEYSVEWEDRRTLPLSRHPESRPHHLFQLMPRAPAALFHDGHWNLRRPKLCAQDSPVGNRQQATSTSDLRHTPTPRSDPRDRNAAAADTDCVSEILHFNPL